MTSYLDKAVEAALATVAPYGGRWTDREDERETRRRVRRALQAAEPAIRQDERERVRERLRSDDAVEFVAQRMFKAYAARASGWPRWVDAPDQDLWRDAARTLTDGLLHPVLPALSDSKDGEGRERCDCDPDGHIAENCERNGCRESRGTGTKQPEANHGKPTGNRCEGCEREERVGDEGWESRDVLDWCADCFREDLLDAEHPDYTQPECEGDPRLGYDLALQALRDGRRVRAGLSLHRGTVEGTVMSVEDHFAVLDTGRNHNGRPSMRVYWNELDRFEILQPDPEEGRENYAPGPGLAYDAWQDGWRKGAGEVERLRAALEEAKADSLKARGHLADVALAERERGDKAEAELEECRDARLEEGCEECEARRERQVERLLADVAETLDRAETAEAKLAEVRAEVEQLQSDEAKRVVVDFLDAWRFCPLSQHPFASRPSLEDAATQLLAALTASTHPAPDDNQEGSSE